MKRDIVFIAKLLYHRTVIGYFLVFPLKAIFTFFRFRIFSDKYYIKRKFKTNFGYDLNLKNPQTINEKIQWLKLYDRTPLHTLCADKFKVRAYIEKKVGPQCLIPLVLATNRVREINPKNLPDYPVIIKTNHDSSGGIMVTDKTKIDWQQTQVKLLGLLRRNYYYRKQEWQYKHIRPQFVVEKLLIDETGQIPKDYKLYCFNGKFQFVQVDIDRHIDHKRNFYDRNWNLLEFKWRYNNGRSVRRPEKFEEMIKLAEALARDFYLLRVDLYQIKNKIYFGELTFHPESGYGELFPAEWDMKLGRMLDIT